MKKLIAMVATLSCLNAIADDCGCEEAANPFEGFSAYLDIDYANAESTVLKNKDAKFKLNNVAATLGGNYRYNTGNNWLVGGGLDIMFTNKKKETASKDKEVIMGNGEEYTFKGTEKVKRSVITPSIYASLGKSFDNVLVELLAGISYNSFKYTPNGKFVSKNGSSQDLTYDGKTTFKANKIVPMVGLKVAYAFNDHVSAYVTGRYMFNAKKHGFTTLKKMFNIGAGISYKF